MRIGIKGLDDDRLVIGRSFPEAIDTDQFCQGPVYPVPGKCNICRITSTFFRAENPFFAL